MNPLTRPAASILLSAVLALGLAVVSHASDQQSVDGMTIYLGVLPAQMISARGDTEADMHGGVPRGRHQYHLVLTVFDDATGERRDDLELVATVHSSGLAEQRRRLEAMEIAGTITYGGYFRLPPHDVPYRIDVQMRDAAGEEHHVEFAYTHPFGPPR
jgi:hypothetical protein